MPETIDSLVIEIEGQSTNAVSALEKLEKTLERIKTVAKGGVSGLNTASRQINRFNEALDGLNLKSVGKLEALSKSFENIEFKTKRLTGSINTNSAAWGRNAAKSIFSIATMVRLGRGIADLITKSTEYTENTNLFNVAMGGYAEEAAKYAQTVSDIMGIDPSEWMRSQGVFMTLATGFGVVGDRAYLMSKNLTQLGYDIASFYNISVEESMQKLKSGFAGELEPLRSVGYDLSQAKLEAIALSLGIDKTVASMTQAEKSQLRYYAIMTQVTQVQGDMARTLESPANQLRIFASATEQAARAIGNIFIPVINKALPYLIASLNVIREIANHVAVLAGFELEIDWDSGSKSTGNIADNMKDIEDSAKKIKDYTMGFDELNIISKSTGKTDTIGDGFDFELPEYDFIANSVETKTKKIEEQIKSSLNSIMFTLDTVGFAVGATLAFTGVNVPIGLGIMAATAVDFFNRQTSGSFDTIIADIEKNAGLIENTVSLIPLAVGAILAFSGANVPLGIGLMAIGAINMASEASVKWGGIDSELQGAIGTIETTLLTAAFVIGGVLAFGVPGMLPLGLGLMVGSGALVATKLAVNWESITSDMTTTITEIGGILGGSLLVLGGVLAFSGANIPVGIGMMALGIASTAAATALNWDTVKETISDKIDDVAGVLGGASLVIGGILAFTGVNLPLGIGLMAAGAVSLGSAIALNWDTVKDKLTEVVAGAVAALSLAGAVVGFLMLFNASTMPLGIGLLFASYKGTQTAYNMSNNPLVEYVTGLANAVIDAVNTAINAINDLLGTSFDTIDRIQSKHTSSSGREHGGGGGSFAVVGQNDDDIYKRHSIKLQKFASGGFPDEGQIFVAREAGAEMVGSISGKTAVANNDQIVEAVSAGVYQAVVAAMKQNGGGESAPEFNIYLDGRQIASSVKRANKERGASILGNEVYAY